MSETKTNLPDDPAYGIDEWMIGWNSATWAPSNVRRGAVEVGPFPAGDWSKKYNATMGCCFGRWHDLTHEQKLQQIVNGFLYLVLSQGLDPWAVHRELWKIADYRTLEMTLFGGSSYIMFRKAH